MESMEVAQALALLAVVVLMVFMVVAQLIEYMALPPVMLAFMAAHPPLME